MSTAREIAVTGAREHNLQSINVSVPRDKMVVITGVSGSGKSSLAFDTIFAEGQRRYVESLSAYVRQFISLLEKPKVDQITGLSPSISIDQKGVSKNPRSTVGTVTEVYDYLRLLFAKIGKPHCPKCGNLVQRQTREQIVSEVMKLPAKTRFMVLSPVIVHTKGEHQNVFSTARQDGFARVRVDQRLLSLSEEIKLAKTKWHDIEIVIDRLVMSDEIDTARLSASVETALRLSGGTVIINLVADGKNDGGEADGELRGKGRGLEKHDEDILYSENFACTKCNTSIQELEPRSFSFNTPHGACADCTGLGYHLRVDPDLVVDNPDLSLAEGAIASWSRGSGNYVWYESILQSLARDFGLDLNAPFKSLGKAARELVLYGTKQPVEIIHETKRGRRHRWRTKFDGAVYGMERRYQQTESEAVRAQIEGYMSQRLCETCGGKRLRAEALAVLIGDTNIIDVCDAPIETVLEWVRAYQGKKSVLTDREQMISEQILKEIVARLEFLDIIGLGYITLNRTASTLSGGESQRIRLATQIGANLTGVLYVCDEPSIGLHPSDNARLIRTLSKLRDDGNTVIIVEHDEAMMRAADHIIDIGPYAGTKGGQVVAEGPVKTIERCKESVTGQYLSGKKTIALAKKRRAGSGKAIEVVGATANNLQNVSVKFPLGKFICVTGVSGSGKSTLVNHILYKGIQRHLFGSCALPGKHKKINGLNNVHKMIAIDQSPIGRTPRSNPATYTGLFTPLRELFAALPESKIRGYTAGRFSFNVKGGRCESCSGAGYTQIEMQFLPDVSVRCDVCKGSRYNKEALEVRFKTHSIADILNMPVADALGLFENIPAIYRRLKTLADVGLEYIQLGQPATTLSGGEAQRVKLATELSKQARESTLYLLDEPTTGLSFYDCDHLIRILQRLVDSKHTVILIEHHLDFIKNADWVIDLGPGAGTDGGKVVAAGTPEQVAKLKTSLTGQFLREVLRTPPQEASKTPKARKASKTRKAPNGRA